MSDQPKNRQELYDRIRESGKDEVILEEMIRLGFWPLAGVLPEDPADEIRHRSQLEAQLRELRTQNTNLHNIEAMKRAARKRRLAESRQRQQETKKRNQNKREARAKDWQERQTQQIGYLGKGVSAGLSQLESDTEKLKRLAIPLLDTPLDLAKAMGVPISQLRFLAFTRTTSKTSHYIQFYIPKRSGGKRLISAPLKRLKTAQSWILKNILAVQAVHEAAHGFVKERSIVTNATPHVKADLVVNLDLKDFFPTISYKRVKGLFQAMGYSEALATLLGLICTEPRSQQIELDGQKYHVAVDERVLPQGSPASPAITNLICRGLDCQLSKISNRLGMTYTRYADDMSFSGDCDANVGRLLRQVHRIVTQEGFSVNPKKTRVFRNPKRKEVTGIVVNERPTLTRKTLRRFRATLFQIEKDGPEGKRWGNSDNTIAAVEGFANYIAMVNPQIGKPLQARARMLVKRYGMHNTPKAMPTQAEKPDAAQTANSDTIEKKDTCHKNEQNEKWWRIW